MLDPQDTRTPCGGRREEKESSTTHRERTRRDRSPPVPNGHSLNARSRNCTAAWMRLVGRPGNWSPIGPGVQLAALQELARFWATEYDWRQCEVRNTLPQFKTKIDGLDIHFIHVRSAHENALPLVMTHGWPLIIELLETIGPLADPTAHGGRRRTAFPPGVAVHPRLRLLRRADRARLSNSNRTGMARADAATRLHALRRAGRRRAPGHRPRWAVSDSMA